MLPAATGHLGSRQGLCCWEPPWLPPWHVSLLSLLLLGLGCGSPASSAGVGGLLPSKAARGQAADNTCGWACLGRGLEASQAIISDSQVFTELSKDLFSCLVTNLDPDVNSLDWIGVQFQCPGSQLHLAAPKTACGADGSILVLSHLGTTGPPGDAAVPLSPVLWGQPTGLPHVATDAHRRSDLVGSHLRTTGLVGCGHELTTPAPLYSSRNRTSKTTWKSELESEHVLPINVPEVWRVSVVGWVTECWEVGSSVGFVLSHGGWVMQSTFWVHNEWCNFQKHLTFWFSSVSLVSKLWQQSFDSQILKYWFHHHQ